MENKTNSTNAAIENTSNANEGNEVSNNNASENVSKESTNVLPKENETTSKEQTKVTKGSTKAKDPLSNKTVLKTIKYTDEELLTFIRKKYSEHNKYFKVLKYAVDEICKKQLKELDETIADLEKKLKEPSKLTMDQLNVFVIKIPILMYKVNSILGEQGLSMEITEHLNNLEVTEKLLHICGGTEKERIRQAEYECMISTFTLLVKSRVYYNIKNALDYSTKLYDGVKKALSAQIEEIKVFGRDMKPINK